MLQIFAQKGMQHIAENGNHGKPQSVQNWTKHIAEKGIRTHCKHNALYGNNFHCIFLKVLFRRTRGFSNIFCPK